jgi:hypothetical protein
MLDAPRIRGQIFLARLDFLRTSYGGPAIARALAALPGADREALKDVQRGAFYPFEALLRLDHVIAELFAPGDPAIFERLGRASARHRTEWLGEHRHLMSVHGFLARVAEGHRDFHSFGTALYRRESFTGGTLAFSQYPLADPIFCLASRGYFAEAVEYLVDGPASVLEPHCQARGDQACEFQIRWSERADLRA